MEHFRDWGSPRYSRHCRCYGPWPELYGNGDSVDKVEESHKQFAEAGRAMDEIVDSVRRVTNIMVKSAAASQEQTQGTEQINPAITQTDQVAEQNAAMVEESAAVAQSWQGQTGSLLLPRSRPWIGKSLNEQTM